MCELCGQPDWYCEHKAKYGFKQITNVRTGTLQGDEFSKLINNIMKTMSLREQEIYLVKKHEELVKQLEKIDWMLARVRGGKKVDIKTDERPDEQNLKA